MLMCGIQDIEPISLDDHWYQTKSKFHNGDASFQIHCTTNKGTVVLVNEDMLPTLFMWPKNPTNDNKLIIRHECATNLLAIATNNRPESLSGNLPKIKFKYFEIQLF